MNSGSLVVPVVLWGPNPPTHCISCVMMTDDQKNIVTGCNDGQICIWDIYDDWQIHPRSLLFGHSTSVSCLASGSNNPEKQYLVSSSDSGEMCLWDISDGRCVEHTKSALTHTDIQPYMLMQAKDLRLICIGYYPEIHIIDPLTLESLFSLSSQVTPDWISAVCILRPPKRAEDVVVGITNSGVVKVWTITGNDLKKSESIYENESKQIRCLNAQTLNCCAYNQRTVLIVCPTYWQVYDLGVKSESVDELIYDAGDFTLLCSESNRCGERWSGGQFISIDKVIVWSNEGKGYLYKLPTNATATHADFHQSSASHSPLAYQVLDVYSKKPLVCSPAMRFYLGHRNNTKQFLLRGDSEGQVALWTIPEISESKMKLARQESFDRLPVLTAQCFTSLQENWQEMAKPPPGIIDQPANLQREPRADDVEPAITATIFIPSQGHLVCGRQDGTITIVSATQSVIIQLLQSTQPRTSLPYHRVLHGHSGQVNCLLYPFNESARYEPQYLVSGGVDFSVILWDIYSGTLLYTFSVHGGEINQLCCPPDNCNTRILSCVCSVASDHSVALLSLRERKCLMMASRHLFPIQTIKWRPLDDFLVAGCTDGTVYVWQMETGNLDRVVHGVTAEEILNACDANALVGEQLVNPTLSLAQAFRRRNLAAFQKLAQQKIIEAANLNQQKADDASGILGKQLAFPLLIQAVRANTKDADSHILFFDTEALIVQLLNEEYATMSPVTRESRGFFKGDQPSPPSKHTAGDQQRPKQRAPPPRPPPPDKQRPPSPKRQDSADNILVLMAKVKETAETVGKQIQQNLAETAGINTSPKESPTHQRKSHQPRLLPIPDQNLTMEIAQLFLSCLHAWGLDPDLDKLSISKLGLLQPKCAISFGLLSRGGHMSLLLPGWYHRIKMAADKASKPAKSVKSAKSVDKADSSHEIQLLTNAHWQISEAVTTNHLLTVISVANTLMSMNHASFIPSKVPKSSLQRRRMMNRGLAVGDGGEDVDFASSLATQQAQIKQGWSLLAALHCVLLPDLIGQHEYRPPQLQMLAKRWQDRCLEIREAAQALLLAELRRIGAKGRKAIVDEWSPYLPDYVDPKLSILQDSPPTAKEQQVDDEDDEEDCMFAGEVSFKPVSSSYESRRKQATAIVMLGVIGAEFGQEIEPNKRSTIKTGDKKKKSGSNVVEGFGISDYSLARHTCKALTYLLLQPATPRLPPYTAIRRAAIDLIGRGFTVWEPYMDVSAILLGLLELSVDADKLVPNVSIGLPLSPQADACRTARHALALIATAHPPTFITTMAKEVARYNALTQSAQAHQSTQLNNSVLVRGRSEILRVVELLVDKMVSDVTNLLVEVVDIILHCIDGQVVKVKGLADAFPCIVKFSMISYCQSSRRICVGARNGGLAFYELKQAKCQVLPAHSGPVTAVAFSPDGKYLVSFCMKDKKISFWQTTSSSIFNMGGAQYKCVKTYATPPLPVTPGLNPMKQVRLVWIDQKTITMLKADGSEVRFRV